MHVIYETPRLIVRKYTLDDAEQALKIYSDPQVMRFLGGGKGKIETLDQMRASLTARIAKYDQTPGLGAWAAQLKSNGKVAGEIVGTILLKDLDGQPEIEVGWHLARRAWGNGYATEGARGAIEHGFKVVKLDRIVAVVFPENQKSIAVTKRLGMKHEGMRRAYNVDLEYFRISPLTWSLK